MEKGNTTLKASDFLEYIYFFIKDEAVYEYLLERSVANKISITYEEIRKTFGFKHCSQVGNIIRRLQLYGLIEKLSAKNSRGLYYIYDLPEKKPSYIISQMSGDKIKDLNYAKISEKFQISKTYAKFLVQQIKAKATFLTRAALKKQEQSVRIRRFI